LKSLDKLGAGERAYIVDMKNSRLCEKLFELGVFPGAVVEMQFNSVDHNSIIVKINGHTYNLYKPAAETIITNTVLFEISLN
jgi:Fe2+ transport system protein FeoA